MLCVWYKVTIYSSAHIGCVRKLYRGTTAVLQTVLKCISPQSFNNQIWVLRYCGGIYRSTAVSFSYAAFISFWFPPPLSKRIIKNLNFTSPKFEIRSQFFLYLIKKKIVLKPMQCNIKVQSAMINSLNMLIYSIQVQYHNRTIITSHFYKNCTYNVKKCRFIILYRTAKQNYYLKVLYISK